MHFNAVSLDNALVESSDASFLVDTVHSGEPLVISFGFVNWSQRPDFDFYGRLKKLDTTIGRSTNRILVRDVNNSWYHRKIPGLGRHVDEVADSLRQIIQFIQPSQVITIGQSMGGYAAIMFGALLQVERILSFGPLSFVCPQQAITYHDRRWLSVMLDLEQNPPPVRYPDLPSLCKQKGEKPELHIFFGTKPDEGATESVNLDVLHAMRYQPLENCHLHPYPDAAHTVVQHLIDTEQINDLLAKHIRGIESPTVATSAALPPDWLSWVQENLHRGAASDEILTVLMQHGFTEYHSRVAIYRCQNWHEPGNSLLE
jgi:hypothetical protein